MLDDATFKLGLKKLMKDCKDGEKSSEDFADGLVDLIKDFVKTGEVTVQPGIAVTTSAGGGSTTSTGTGSIS